MTNAYPRFGVWFVDHAVMFPRYKNWNRGHNGFLCFVETLSNKTVILPVKDKTTGSWEQSVEKLIREYEGDVSVLVSDRDSAVSKKFTARLRKQLGIRWIFLYNRNKAFKAERAIGFFKSRLSMSMKGRESKNWVDFVPGLMNKYNAQYVRGTQIRRNDVSKRNYLDVLAQRYKTKSPSLFFNVSVGKKFLPQIAKKLWLFEVGDKVLLSKKAKYSSLKKTFEKKTVEGNYDPEIFEITDRLIKTSSDFYLNPVYKIRGESSGPLQGSFYESELVPAKFVA